MMRKIKDMSAISKSFLLSFFVFAILAFLIGSQTFLQIPVSPNADIMWKTLVEQTFTLIPLAVVLYSLYKTITLSKRKHPQIIDENKLRVPAFILVYISGISVGIHGSTEIIQHLVSPEGDPFVKKTFLILDEFVGHVVVLTAFVLLFFLSLIEINRLPQKASKTANRFYFVLATIVGLMSGILSIEAGWSHVVLFPLIFIFFYFYSKFLKQHRIKIKNYPYSAFVYHATKFYLIAVVIWCAIFGVFTQPLSLLK